MNDHNSNENGPDDVARLIRFAGERTALDDERMAAARANVGAHWREVVAARRRKSSPFRTYAIAAGVVVALGVSFMLAQRGVPTAGSPESLIVAERVTGAVLIDGRELRDGDLLETGAVIETGVGGRAALGLPAGKSMRLDVGTRLVVLAGDRVELDSGGVYVDSGPGAGHTPTAIVTRHGVATDVGTQFQVRIEAGRLGIGVREGMVELTRPGANVLEIDSGSLVEVSADGASADRDVAGNDPIWSWVATILPAFVIEGATLEDYLEWYARESGLRLEWETAASKTVAGRTVLSGTIDGLSLDEGLQVVRRIAPFEMRQEGAAIHVRVD